MKDYPIYRCKKCGWSGHFPNSIDIVTMDGICTQHTPTPFCPDCEARVYVDKK